MPAKSLVLEGFGTVMIQPINIKEKESETVDTTGNPVKITYSGTRATRKYVTEDGTEVPSSQICKKIEVEGEELILPKFQPTKEVANENIEVLDDASLIYRGIDRKFYNVVTDNEKIKDLVLNQNKALCFPLAAGFGWKIWKGILTNWNGKLLLVGVIGDIQKELEKYTEDTVELEIEIIPQHKNMKKLVMAMACV